MPTIASIIEKLTGDERVVVQDTIHRALRNYGYSDDPAWSITDSITHELRLFGEENEELNR